MQAFTSGTIRIPVKPSNLCLVRFASASRFAFTILWPCPARPHVKLLAQSSPEPRTFFVSERPARRFAFSVWLQKNSASSVFGTAPLFAFGDVAGLNELARRPLDLLSIFIVR